MSTPTINRNEKLKRLYRWGLLGLIPNVGFIAGLILLYKGIVRYKDKKLVLIGILDILFTVVFICVMQYEIGHGSWFANSEAEFAKSGVNTLVKSIEFYKTQHGAYPDSLEQVENIPGYVWINDPMLPTVDGKKQSELHYKKIRNKYTLFSVGIDRIPNTSDDIYPTITNGDTIRFGFVKK